MALKKVGTVTRKFWPCPGSARAQEKIQREAGRESRRVRVVRLSFVPSLLPFPVALYSVKWERGLSSLCIRDRRERERERETTRDLCDWSTLHRSKLLLKLPLLSHFTF